MRPVYFPQHNVVLGSNQEEYTPMPAWRHEDHKADPNGTVVSCWELSLWERLKLLWTGRFWLSQMAFHDQLQRPLPSVDSPFVPNVTPARLANPL